MKKITLLLLILCTMGYAQAQKLSPIQSDIKKLMEITGSGDLGKQIAVQMIGQFKSTYPDVPNEFWMSFEKEIDGNDLIALTIPIYEKYYTHKEIKKLLKFYNTTIGKKTIKVMPKLMHDSMTSGQEWGEQLAKKVIARLQEKNLIEN